jgi:hypothetical protein
VAVVAFAIVALVVAGGVWWFQYQLKRKRVANLFAVARRLGFQFSEDDPHDTLGLPFPLFTKGVGRRVENVMWGERDGVPLRAFDYWYYTETSDTKGNRSRQYHRYTCAAMVIAADCPSLRIGHEDFMTRLGGALGFHDIGLEYDDFNREFRVRWEDEKFAFSLLDGHMMELLLRVGSIDALEIVGPFVLITTGKLASEDWPALIDTATQFHAHIPNIVWTTWPRVGKS